MACESVRAMLLGALLAAAPAALAAQEPPAGQQPPAAPSAPAQPPLDPQAVQRRISTMHDGALADSSNGDGLMRETDGYRRLLQNVAAMDPAEVSARATLTLDRKQALAQPDALRGELVRVRGLLAGLRAERLDKPLDGAVDIWQGVVGDTDGSDGIVFDILVRPENLEVRTDVVDVEGVFYRTARYRNAKDELVEAPYIIARNVTRVDTSALPAEGFGGGPFAAVLVGLGVIYVVARVLVLLKDRKSPKAGDSTTAIRRAAERQRREALARKPPDPSSPTGPSAKLP